MRRSFRRCWRWGKSREWGIGIRDQGRVRDPEGN
jgi:hypothetical protein